MTIPQFEITPADTRERHAAWMALDHDSRRAQGTGAWFTDTVSRDEYPGDPAVWDALRDFDARLKALQALGRTTPVTALTPPRGRIPSSPVDYLRRLDELDRCDAVDAARSWADDGGNLLLVGSVGTGKTSIGCALCVDFGAPEAFWPVRDLLGALKAADFDASDVHAGRRFRDTLASRLLLVVDDVGAERGTEWERDALRGLLETRCGRPVCTVVTTNLTAAQREEYLGARLASRLAGWRVVAVLGPDRRRSA